MPVFMSFYTTLQCRASVHNYYHPSIELNDSIACASFIQHTEMNSCASSDNIKQTRAPHLSTSGSEFGFPEPGIQFPVAAAATMAHYFVDDTKWNNIMSHSDFDDIVVGSGFCALAYVDEALRRNPFRKILILERGGYWLPTHLQNLPLPFTKVIGGPSETFPWTLSIATRDIPELGFMRGSYPFFGGRSTFWSSWCPQPSADLMRNFPQSMKDTAASPAFWEKSKKLLCVTTANKINNKIYAKLQNDIDERLERAISEGKIPTAEQTQPAPLAVGKITTTSTISFNKFSTPGPLLTICERQRQLARSGKGSPLVIALNCVVKKFHTKDNEENAVTKLETSRGILCFPNKKTNIILAAGAIPSTTIVLNSLENMGSHAGTRITGHFLTHITARFPVDQSDICPSQLKSHLEYAANYLSGRDPDSKLQYHVQIIAIHSPSPEEDAVDAGREHPDYAVAVTAEQLKGSERHIILVCATLGEMDENNPESWVRHNPLDPDITTNVKLQLTLTEKDKKLWNVMDKATYTAISIMAGIRSADVDYWHKNKNGPGSWKKGVPAPQNDIHIPGIVHEASTLYMGGPDFQARNATRGESSRPSVDASYQLYGCKNVYVAGAALFPTAGSWNPVLAICGYAQDLATKIVEKPRRVWSKL